MDTSKATEKPTTERERDIYAGPRNMEILIFRRQKVEYKSPEITARKDALPSERDSCKIKENLKRQTRELINHEQRLGQKRKRLARRLR
jgi:hypothetical protein